MSLCHTHKENWRNNKTRTKKIWNFCVLESLLKTIKFLACLKAKKTLNGTKQSTQRARVLCHKKVEWSISQLTKIWVSKKNHGECKICAPLLMESKSNIKNIYVNPTPSIASLTIWNLINLKHYVYIDRMLELLKAKVGQTLARKNRHELWCKI